MNAPTNEARKFGKKEFPPTALLTHSEGMSPSFPGLPRSIPATSTPNNRSGNICLANPQLEPKPLAQFLFPATDDNGKPYHARDKRHCRFMRKHQGKDGRGESRQDHLPRRCLEPGDKNDRQRHGKKPVINHL